MTFDVWAALAEIEASNDSADAPKPKPLQPHVATNKTKCHPSNLSPEITNEALIIQTVQFGASRHGAIATGANLGTTVTYRLIDKLVASGRLMQAKAGTITVRGNK